MTVCGDSSLWRMQWNLFQDIDLSWVSSISWRGVGCSWSILNFKFILCTQEDNASQFVNFSPEIDLAFWRSLIVSMLLVIWLDCVVEADTLIFILEDYMSCSMRSLSIFSVLMIIQIVDCKMGESPWFNLKWNEASTAFNLALNSWSFSGNYALGVHVADTIAKSVECCYNVSRTCLFKDVQA